MYKVVPNILKENVGCVLYLYLILEEKQRCNEPKYTYAKKNYRRLDFQKDMKFMLLPNKRAFDHEIIIY
jgi:hypothetical protein